MPSVREEYLFDLRGYTVIPQALDAGHLRAVNEWIDALPLLEQDQWYGNVYVHTYGGVDGTNLQDVFEAGEIFERLIDHPAWIDHVRHYLGPSTRPYIHETLLNIREAAAISASIRVATIPTITSAAGATAASGCAACCRSSCR